jgi:hypothetical protein
MRILAGGEILAVGNDACFIIEIPHLEEQMAAEIARNLPRNCALRHIRRKLFRATK